LVVKTSQYSLIPPVIAGLYHAILNPDGKTGYRLIGRRAEGGAGFNIETGAMPGANDLLSINDFSRFQPATQHGRAVVGTDILNGIIPAIQVENGNISTFYINESRLPRTKFTSGCDVGPI
jgi:hypothetical protein